MDKIFCEKQIELISKIIRVKGSHKYDLYDYETVNELMNMYLIYRRYINDMHENNYEELNNSPFLNKYFNILTDYLKNNDNIKKVLKDKKIILYNNEYIPHMLDEYIEYCF